MPGICSCVLWLITSNLTPVVVALSSYPGPLDVRTFTGSSSDEMCLFRISPKITKPLLKKLFGRHALRCPMASQKVALKEKLSCKRV